jgi:putative ABC transport system substrate-binding protein
MKRRDFIAWTAGAAFVPPSARAQALPVIGFLHSASPDGNADRVRAFRAGLKETGFVEGENVTIEYRWAENQIDRLPALATELVHRKVTVIAALVPRAAFAAKTATSTIPIVFVSPEDPAKTGLVASLARPGGNLTGVNFFPAEVAAKGLELVRELLPGATRIAVLIDPQAGPAADTTLREVEGPARAMGLQIQVHNARDNREIDAVFGSFARERPDAMITAISAFFGDRRVQLILQAMRHRLPTTYPVRDFAEAGGLISYGASLRDAIQQAGVYTGRILKGAKPADLPVVQATRFELVINNQTARLLGLTVPPSLLARADEVIE